VLPDHVLQVTGVVVNEGAPVQVPYDISYLLDGEPVWTEPGPLLGAGEEAEIHFSWEVTPGEYVLTVVLDPEDVVEELREDNNSISHIGPMPGWPWRESCRASCGKPSWEAIFTSPGLPPS